MESMSDQDIGALIAAFGAAIVVGLAIYYVILTLFLFSMFKTLKNCGEHATMQPGLAFLNLIPLFNFAWLIYSVIKVSESINKKFSAHGLVDQGEGGKTIGLVFSISNVAALIIPFVGLVSFVCWIIYWVKLSGYNSTLPQMSDASAQA